MKIWHKQDYKTMPWKNGGGSTTELAVFPEGAGLDEFYWRLSMAQVSSDGAFSHFAQIDRTLAILIGQGLVLVHDNEGYHEQEKEAASVRLQQDTAPYRFSGETAIFAEIIDGPVLDLNMMTRRDVCSHFMRRLETGDHYFAASDAQQVLVYCAKGAARVDETLDLLEGDLLLLEEDHLNTGIALQLQIAEDATCYLMRISFLNHAGQE